MNKLKYFFIGFLLFFYMNFIIEEWNLLNKLGKNMIYPAWFIKSIIFWLISPIFIPIYLLPKNPIITNN